MTHADTDNTHADGLAAPNKAAGAAKGYVTPQAMSPRMTCPGAPLKIKPQSNDDDDAVWILDTIDALFLQWEDDASVHIDAC